MLADSAINVSKDKIIKYKNQKKKKNIYIEEIVRKKINNVRITICLLRERYKNIR